MKHILLLPLIFSLFAACSTLEVVKGKFSLTKADNSRRYASVWHKKIFFRKDLQASGLPQKLSHIHGCMEFVGPSARMKNIGGTSSLGDTLSFDKAKKERILKSVIQYNESLATLYRVSEVLQFGHAAMYRLCEARGNGDMDAAQYRKNFRYVLRQMVRLMALSLKQDIPQMETSLDAKK